MNSKSNTQNKSKAGLPELPLFRFSPEQRAEVSVLIGNETTGSAQETAVNLFEEIARKFERRLLKLGRLAAVDRRFRRGSYLWPEDPFEYRRRTYRILALADAESVVLFEMFCAQVATAWKAVTGSNLSKLDDADADGSSSDYAKQHIVCFLADVLEIPIGMEYLSLVLKDINEAPDGEELIEAVH